MSYEVQFEFSVGLAKPIYVPKGTLTAILKHVVEVESKLGLKAEQYQDNPPHWSHWMKKEALAKVPDEVLCDEVEWHNDWVRSVYRMFAECSKNPVRGKKGEKITPEDAQKFWHALEMLDVASEQWTAAYYQARMETFYEVMRGRPTEGITFDTKPLSVRQAAEVIVLFSEFLDRHDIRLDVPRGHDHLASSDDGGYVWCEKCGAVDPEDAAQCRKRGCPVREEEE